MEKQSQKGFSIVELLVTMFIFSIIGGIAAGFLISGIGAQRRSNASQQVFDQMFHALEHMSRALRSAQKPTDNSCIPLGSNYETLYEGEDAVGIRFIRREGECWEFVFADEQIQKKVNGEDPVSLTSQNTLAITSFRVYVSESQGGSLAHQPRVTLSLQGESVTGREENIQRIRIQTTVSQRAYNTQ